MIEGEPYESFNEELTNLRAIEIDEAGNEVEKPLELLAADLRPESVKNRNFKGYEKLEENKDPQLDVLTNESIKILKNTEIYRIMATILGVNYGDLRQRHKERRLRRMVQLSALVAVFLTIFGIAMTNMYFKAVAAEREATQQTSMMILKAADQANQIGDRGFALLVSEEAMSKTSPEMNSYSELVANYNRILNDALLSPEYSTQQVLKTDSETPFYDVSIEGGWLVSGGELNTAKIWNISNGEILKSLEFGAPVSAVKISPDNTVIYVATKDGKLHKVDSKTYEQTEVIGGMDIFIRQIGNSSDGKFLFGVKGSKILEVYNTNDFNLVSRQEAEGLRTYLTYTTIMKNKNEYIVAYSDSSIIHYDMATGEIINEIEPKDETSDYISRAVSISDDGNIFAYSGIEKINVFNIETGEKSEITDSVRFPNNIVLNKDGSLLYAETSSGSIGLWDTNTLEFKKSFNIDKHRIELFSLSTNQDKLVVAFSDDYSIGIFENVDDKDALTTLGNEMISSPGSAHDEKVIGVKFVMGDKYIISTSQDSTIKIISTESTLSQRSIKGRIKAITSDGNMLLLMDEDQNISTYEFSSDMTKELGQVDLDYGNMFSKHAISNNGEYFAFSSVQTMTVNVFDNGGNRIYSTKPHKSANPLAIISDIKFSEDSNELFSLGEDGEVYITDMSTGELTKELKDLDEIGVNFILSHDGSLIAINYGNKTSTIMNTVSGDVIERFEGEILTIQGENGNLSNAVGQHGKRLFELVNGKVEYYASNEERKGIVNRDLNYDFVSKDGRFLITTVSGQATIVTDLNTGYRVRTLNTESELVSKAVMSSDNKKIAYEYSEDNTIVSEFYTIEDLEKMAKNELGDRVMTEDERADIGLISRVRNE